VRLIPLLLVAGIAPAQVITTLAGNTWVFRGAGGPAVNASLGPVRALAADPAGNVYIADSGNRMVLKVDPAGIVSVVAGNGLWWFSGDGGPAINASFTGSLHGMALDAAGNLYVSDSSNQRIRRISPAGIVDTVAGNGVAGYSGDGGPARQAQLNFPAGLAVDAAGNLYIADRSNHRVRQVAPDGTITTIAGTGVAGFGGDGGDARSAQLNGPMAVAVDALGNIFISDQNNNRVRRIIVGGTISTAAGTGSPSSSGDGRPGPEAAINAPYGLVFDAAGRLYIAEPNGHRVRRLAGGIITTVAGTGVSDFSGDGGPAIAATLSQPAAVAVDAAGNLLIGEHQNMRVRRVAAEVTISSAVTTFAGAGSFKFAGDGGPGTKAFLNAPNGIALHPDGSVYFHDPANRRIRRIAADGVITTVAGTGLGGFTGDGVPAASSRISTDGVVSLGLAFDGAGNLYFADLFSRRIRKISPSGILTTVAGTGSAGFSGDGGLATSARLDMPRGVAVDGVGNIFFCDSNTHRVRKIDASGTISTVAGNGTAAFSGDGGLATAASLNSPFDVVVDAAGNLYIADTNNFRIRQVSAGGMITTIAGTGVQGFSGDGGPALSAKFSEPGGLAFDSAGNLYVADRTNGRVRKITPAGNISTVAGDGLGRLADGKLATQSSMYPSDVAVDAAGNLYIADSGNDRIRLVLAAPPSLTVTPASLRFTAPAGGPSPDTQSITVSSSLTGLVWKASATPAAVTLSPPTGATPSTATVRVDVSGLAAGVYSGAVTITAPSSPAAVTVPVEIAVTAPKPPAASVEPAALSFRSAPGATPNPQTLVISNAGGGTLTFSAKATTTSGGAWLQLSAAGGTATAGSPARLQVTVNTTGLAAGAYAGSISVDGVTVPVTLLLSAANQVMLLTQTGLRFTGVAGGGVVPSHNVGVLNIGQGALNWTAEASTLSGGAWLRVSPASGRSDAGSAEFPSLEVLADATGLAAGSYSGQVRITAAGASNSPQYVTVHFIVLAAGSNPGVVLRPTGLVFVAAGGTNPGSLTVRMATARPGSADVRGSAATFEETNWLDVTPLLTTLSPAEPRTFTVQPDISGLAPGVHYGALTLIFADGSPAQVVDVLLLVTPASGAESAAGSAACTPSRLLVVQRVLSANFSASVSYGTPVEAQVVDDCGANVTNATVVASFSSGDPPLTLASLGNGIYSGTWKPHNSTAQVTVRVRADRPPLQAGESTSQGVVTGGGVLPAVYTGGLVSAASYTPGQPLAPGGIISVFGQNLAAAQGAATTVPLGTTLAGATLTVGGYSVPLYYASGGQINAQLPVEMAPNAAASFVLRAQPQGGGPEMFALPETITVAAAQPGIFTTNQAGTGQGAILDAQGRVVNEQAPAAAGQVVQVYCTGLGDTQPRVASGQAPPGGTLATVLAAVTATLGGLAAPVQFAGIAPGYVGLYQVNVQVPAGVAPGAAPLVITAGGAASNQVTLAVR
jgi:uncharacterized protein (TIGR03437 family)